MSGTKPITLSEDTEWAVIKLLLDEFMPFQGSRHHSPEDYYEHRDAEDEVPRSALSGTTEGR